MRGRRGKHWVLGWRGSSYGPVLDTQAEHNTSGTAWDKPARKLYYNHCRDDNMKLVQSHMQSTPHIKAKVTLMKNNDKDTTEPSDSKTYDKT